MLTHLTKKPGEFKAHCRLATVVKISKATHEQRHEATQLGLRRHLEGKDSRGKDIWTWHFPACAGFETTDREEYQAHLGEFHNGGRLKLEGPPIAVPVRMWTGPRLTADGKALTKVSVEQIQTCPTCDLHGQVENVAGELWWAEHIRGCALASQAAAS